ncbi:MAG: UbiA family prenyltransferase [Elusimicrobia bacterium]|nr:UbiA family prenyltransferase [Elusimicrobiota bacterium]
MADIPLCVDLDGTLVRSDLLIESAAALVKTQPWRLLVLPFWSVRGLAFLKRRLADSASLDVDALPLHGPLLERLREAKAAGRRLVLATAADESLARRVAGRVGLFDEVLASADGVNLIGEAKARVLVERFGWGGFDYAGDHANDLPVWRAARKAILVDAPERLAEEVAALVPVERVFSSDLGRLREAWRAVRPHQWGKNLIVFVPVVASHRLELPVLGQALSAAAAFSLCASSVYLLNDLLDLQADRASPVKKARPFAAGSLPLSWALLALPLLAAAAGIASLLPAEFGWVLAGYYVLTLLYSLKLRSVVVLDVLCLAGLYTARLFAGHAATGIPYSPWLSGFSLFLFLSLALMKRYVEFSGSAAAPAGRGYGAADALLLRNAGLAGTLAAVLIFAFYIRSQAVAPLYTRPGLLWLVGLLILFALGRMWLLARRGGLDDDPVRFVLRDKTSWLCAALTAAVLAAASGWTS